MTQDKPLPPPPLKIPVLQGSCISFPWAKWCEEVSTVTRLAGLTTTDSPEFADLTLSDLTASRIVATDVNKKLVSVGNLGAWITGTTNQVMVTDDTDGTVTLSLPQDIAATSTPTFAGLNVTSFILPSFTANSMVYIGAGGALACTAAATNGQLLVGSTGAVPALATLTGTANQVTITNAAAAITLSLPQNIHTGASPAFVTVKCSGLTDGYVPYHVADATGLADSPMRISGGLTGFGVVPTYLIHGYTTGAPTNKIFALADSAVAHGMTTIEETTVYGSARYGNPSYGQLLLRGLASAVLEGMRIESYSLCGTPDVSGFTIRAYKKSGTGVTDLGATDYLCDWYNNGTSKMRLLGNGQLTAVNYVSTIATGTAPIAVTSTTVCGNLNADYLDGQHGAYYWPAQTGTEFNIPVWNSATAFGASKLWNTTTGVGVNTIDPVSMLEVYSTTAATVLTISANYGTANSLPQIQFRNTANESLQTMAAIGVDGAAVKIAVGTALSTGQYSFTATTCGFFGAPVAGNQLTVYAASPYQTVNFAFSLNQYGCNQACTDATYYKQLNFSGSDINFIARGGDNSTAGSIVFSNGYASAFQTVVLTPDCQLRMSSTAMQAVLTTGNPTYRGQIILETGNDGNQNSGIEFKDYWTSNGYGARIYMNYNADDLHIGMRSASATWTDAIVVSNGAAKNVTIPSGSLGIGTTPGAGYQLDILSPANLACVLHLQPTTGTYRVQTTYENTGGIAAIGIEDAGGASMFTGSTAYAMCIGTCTMDKPIEFFVYNSKIAYFNSVGLIPNPHATPALSRTIHCIAQAAAPASTTAGALWVDTDASTNGDLMVYANGGWRKVVSLP